jgi:hypothetical protein
VSDIVDINKYRARRELDALRDKAREKGWPTADAIDAWERRWVELGRLWFNRPDSR